MTTTVLCVPQWQGSASRNASRLVAGARRTAGLVGADALVTVPVLEAGGDKRAGIRALDVLLENLRLTRQALAGVDGTVITAGGDCGVDLAPIAAAGARHGEALTVLWFDAHPEAKRAPMRAPIAESAAATTASGPPVDHPPLTFGPRPRQRLPHPSCRESDDLEMMVTASEHPRRLQPGNIAPAE
jgi:hypothetical protein